MGRPDDEKEQYCVPQDLHLLTYGQGISGDRGDSKRGEDRGRTKGLAYGLTLDVEDTRASPFPAPLTPPLLREASIPQTIRVGRLEVSGPL